MDSILIIWLVMLVAFIVIEAVTVQLITLWFALGSISAIIANLFGAPEWLQFVIFVAVSVVSLLISRPILMKRIKKRKAEPTNADMCIGAEALVIQEIDNTTASGQVNCKGVIWTARSENGEIIKEGQTVLIKSISGVKVIVTPITEDK